MSGLRKDIYTKYYNILRQVCVYISRNSLSCVIATSCSCIVRLTIHIIPTIASDDFYDGCPRDVFIKAISR